MPRQLEDALFAPTADEIITRLAPMFEEVCAAYRSAVREPTPRHVDKLSAELSRLSSRVHRLRDALTED